MTTGGLAEYTPANAFMPVGFSETAIGSDRVQVNAGGHPSTPYARLEKIATARAAEIGKERKIAYFKVTGSTRDVACTKKVSGYKVADTAATARPKVTLDVLYSATASDPTYKPTAETFARLTEELKTDSYSPEEMQAIASEVQVRCAG